MPPFSQQESTSSTPSYPLPGPAGVRFRANNEYQLHLLFSYTFENFKIGKLNLFCRTATGNGFSLGGNFI